MRDRNGKLTRRQTLAGAAAALGPGWQFIELDVPRGGMLTHPELVAETFANLN